MAANQQILIEQKANYQQYHVTHPSKGRYQGGGGTGGSSSSYQGGNNPRGGYGYQQRTVQGGPPQV